MESAINPISLISGRISSRAIAAPVEVGIMLFITERFRLKSLVPDFGGESSMLWLFVAACTVDIEAVTILEVSSVSSRGFIMWAKAVVVQLAAEMM